MHRLVLAASSDYFSRLFASSFADSNSPTVELKDVDPTSFNIMLEFFYGADLASLLPKVLLILILIFVRHLTLPPQDLPDPTPLLSDLLQLGTRFFATPFIQSCLELLLRHLKFSGLVDIWEASRPLPNFLPSSASPATSSSTPSPSPLLSSPSSVIAYSSPSSSPPILRRLVRFFTHNVKDWDARVIKQLLSSPTRCEEIKLTLLDLSLRSEYDKEKLPPKA